jgi:hypothetical protein
VGQIRLLTALCLGMLAHGEAYALPAEDLAKAREAISEGKRRDAREALDDAHRSFLEGDSIVLNDVLAQYWFYRGLVAQKRGKRAATMEALRQTLIVDRSFVWDREMLDDLELRKMFEALRGEVEGRDVHSPNTPEKTGCAVLYVDGSKIAFGGQVSIGERLAQIQCPKGDVYGAWSDFDEDEPFNWLAMCPYEVDTSVEVLAEQQPEDEFAQLGATFGSDTALSAGPCAVDTSPPTDDGGMAADETPVADETPATPEVNEEPVGPGFFAPELWPSRRLLAAGTGVALLGGGVGLHYAVVVPSFKMVEWGRRNARGITRYQADILTERFRTRRAISWGVMGAGAVTTGVGLFLFKPTNLAVQPMWFPGGGGLHGQF